MGEFVTSNMLRVLLTYAVPRYLEEAFPGREWSCVCPDGTWNGTPSDRTNAIVRALTASRLLLLHLYAIDTRTYQIHYFEREQHAIWRHLEAASEGLNIRYCFNGVDDLECRPLGFQRAAYILGKNLLVPPSTIFTNFVRDQISAASSLAEGVRQLPRGDASGPASVLLALCERYIRCGDASMDSLLLLVWREDRLISLAGTELAKMTTAVLQTLNIVVPKRGVEIREPEAVLHHQEAMREVIPPSWQVCDFDHNNFGPNVLGFLRQRLNALLANVPVADNTATRLTSVVNLQTSKIRKRE